MEASNGGHTRNGNGEGQSCGDRSGPRDQSSDTPLAARTGAPGLVSPAQDATQIVSSVEEGNALVKRLRQLERENDMLSSSLTKVCDENARLTAQMTRQEEKCIALATAPLSSTSVLRSLFEPEKSGWFGGSKSAARENLEKLAEELQREFVQYKADHASSNEEVQALIGELQSAHMTAQSLSSLVHELQGVISRGPLAVAVRIVSGETDAENTVLADLRRELERRNEREAEIRQELRHTREELKAKAIENAQHVQELQSLRLNGDSKLEVEQQRKSDDIARLMSEVAQLQQALAAEERLHKLKVQENTCLSQRVGELERQLAGAAAREVKTPSLESPPTSVSTQRYNELQQECDAANERANNSNRTVRELESRLTGMQRANEEEVHRLRLTVTELEHKLNHSVPQSALKQAQTENRRILQELELTSMRAKHMEDWLESERAKKLNNSCRSRESNFSEIDDAKILETLERNKERIARLETQRNELIEEGKKLGEAAMAKEEELLRATRATQEDKQRINFLMKRCVTLTDDLKAMTASKDALNEQYESSQLEVKKLQRQSEELVVLNQRIDELKQKNEALQARLSGVEELENQLVKAKETIACMELDQSRTISKTQYAEMQSRNAKLENTLEPIRRQLEEATKELERLKTENESQRDMLSRQQNAIKSHEEKEATLQASDAKLREKVNQLTAECTRLRDVNDTLEKQMANMQDGIKEMAVKLEQERSKAMATAETTYRGEIEQLQAKLEVANATLARVRSAQDAVVPEGIHRAIVAEKERGDAEIKQKNYELDKLKSEILIYRHTIDDLESENEEHVRQIELLQAAHQKERTAASDRLETELKKLSEASLELDQLRSQLQGLQQREEQLLAQQKVMEEAAQKHRRAFEDKCCQEEKLLATVAATSQVMEQQQEELNRARILAEQYQRQQKELESEVVSGAAAAEMQRQLEEECDALRGELQRAIADKEAMELELEKLRGAMKNSSHSDAGILVRGVGDDDANSAAAMSPDAATQYARAEQLMMSLIQTQRQLEEQKQYNMEAAQTFGKTLDRANAEAEALRHRVQELESELDGQAMGVDTSLSSNTRGRPKKKKKSSKRSLSAIARLDDVQTTDVLCVDAANGGATQERQPQHERDVMLDELERELSVLRDENAQLREKIATLQQELQHAQSDLEFAVEDNNRENAELREQIRFLEARLQEVSNDTRKDTQFRASQQKNKRCQTEMELPKEPPGDRAEKLDTVVRQLQSEVQALAQELVPTKNKLVEYMAMADRLGIQYPFSADMEGAAVLRLKAMQFDSRTGRSRAMSAPRRVHDSLPGRAMIPLDIEKRTRKKRRHKSDGRTDPSIDLR